jgi:hypothetical protein
MNQAEKEELGRRCCQDQITRLINDESQYIRMIKDYETSIATFDQKLTLARVQRVALEAMMKLPVSAEAHH